MCGMFSIYKSRLSVMLRGRVGRVADWHEIVLAGSSYMRPKVFWALSIIGPEHFIDIDI